MDETKKIPVPTLALQGKWDSINIGVGVIVALGNPSHMLKGYVIKENNIDRRYRASSYDTMIRYIPVMKDIIEKSYGKALCNISNPLIIDSRVLMNIENSVKSRQIIHSFALKLRELLLCHVCFLQPQAHFYQNPSMGRIRFLDPYEKAGQEFFSLARHTG